MNRRMYIALEGAKGSGKSTLYKRLCDALEARGARLVRLCPTRPLEGGAIEWLARLPGVRDLDVVRERLYAARSNHHARQARAAQGSMILGDRSIFTSYATRWSADTEAQRRATIKRVNQLEHEIALPHHVLYLRAPIDELVRRVSARRRGYGRIDETPARLAAVSAAYDDLRAHGRALGFGHVQWHELDATRSPEHVLDATLSLVTSLCSSAPYEVSP